ncbi:MAG TPA: asparagine synthase (glutamine-hydrolyzing) [Cytophagaceae bacterium]|jgi:asparagine synthase (glutamine-hydrolysing)
MCGIAGFLSKDKKYGYADLKKMNDLLQRRGPDAEGFFIDRGIGLAHRRLSILDLSEASNQPMKSSCGNYVLIFNGEIYNYLELAKKYALSLRTSSDTEVILELFIALGEECVAELNGMFSFAIWNVQTKSLFLARDRMGVKPLFYYWDGDTFIFASEIKSIISLVKPAMNATAIGSFLHLGYIPSPNTFYQNIFKFPSGHKATIDSDLRLYPYWKLEDQIEEKTVDNFLQAKKKLDGLINSSVKYRLVSDVPFGTFLSGGIDSSLITSIAQRHYNKKLSTFSIGFKESKYNELPYALEVSKHLNTDHHEFIVSKDDAISHIEEALDVFDEPFADSSFLPTMMVSMLAGAEVKMILSGDGGDELFHGYGAYKWASRLDLPYYKAFKYPLKKALQLIPGSRYHRISQMFSYGSTTYLPGHIFSQEQNYFSISELNALVLRYQEKDIFNILNKYKRKLSVVQQQSLFDLKYYLQDDLLVKVDRASMHHSLEVRVPFLDYRIVKYALNINEKFKSYNGISKFILKEILYDYVPKSFFDRPKWGFSIPMMEWLKNELYYLIEKYANEEIITKHQVLSYAIVKKLKDKYLSGEDYLYNRIWVIIILHRWMEKNLPANA